MDVIAYKRCYDMSSLRDRLRNIQQATPENKEAPVTEQPKQEQPQAEQQQTTAPKKVNEKIVARITDISEDLDHDKLQSVNNTINENIFKFILYPVNLLDRLLIVLTCSKERRAVFIQRVYIYYAVILVLTALTSFLAKDYSLIIGAGIGVGLFEIIQRSIRK